MNMRHQTGLAAPRKSINSIIHVLGIGLVLNSLNTYLFQLIFTRCTSSGIRLECQDYGSFSGIVQVLSDMAILNLLLRFMVLIGFGLDLLALAYLSILLISSLRSK